MSFVSIDLTEVHNLAHDLQSGADNVTGEAQRIVAAAGMQTVALSQVLAPVDTGALKSSISVDIDALAFEAGPTVEYGGYVELGTSRMAAQPYLGPGFDQAVELCVDELGDAGEDIL